MQERSKISPSDIETAIRDTLATIVEIDRWYDLERGELDVYPEAIRGEVAAEIERRRRSNRQPYVLHLARLHQMTVSARIFGDPAMSLRPRRTGSSDSATLANRRGVPFASEALGLGDANQQ